MAELILRTSPTPVSTPVIQSQSANQRRVLLLISVACVVPAVLSVFQQYLQAKLGGHLPRWQDLVFAGGDWLFLGALTPIAYYLAERFPLDRPRWGRMLAAHVAGALLLCVGWSSLGFLLGSLLHTYPALGPLAHAFVSWMLFTAPFSFCIYFAILGCVYAFSYFVQAQERESDAAHLRAQLAEARLDALRMQLNPHFLFNSLNALSVLVREENTPAALREIGRAHV